MAKLGVFLPPDAVYSDLEATRACLQSIIADISRTDALFWCGRLNLAVSNPLRDQAAVQRDLVVAFFPDPVERVCLERWVEQHGGFEHAVVFFRSQLLELARWVAIFAQDQPGDGQTFNSASVRRRFAQAALVSSALWGQRVYPDVTEDVMRRAKPAQHLIHATRISYIENAHGSVPAFALGRGWHIWTKLMPDIAPNIESDFMDATGGTIREYFHAIVLLTSRGAEGGPPERLNAGLVHWRYFDAVPEFRDVFQWALLRESILVETLTQIMRVTHRRGHIGVFQKYPLLRTRDGRAVILDAVFFAQHSVVGPLFELVGAAGSDYRRVNWYFEQFGTAFERYVQQMVAERYPCIPGLARRSFLSLKLHRGASEVAEIDAVVVTGAQELCLIETKAVFLQEARLGSAEEHRAELIRQYSRGTKQVNKEGTLPMKGGAQHTKRRGVGQLAHQVAELSRGQLDELPRELLDATKILTLMVVNDPFFDAPGHTSVLNDEFVRELAPDEDFGNGVFRKGRLTAATPVVLTVDDFEWLEASLTGFSLGDFLREYALCGQEIDVRTFVLSSRFADAMCNPDLSRRAAQEAMQDVSRAVSDVDTVK